MAKFKIIATVQLEIETELEEAEGITPTGEEIETLICDDIIDLGGYIIGDSKTINSVVEQIK